jgi:hypothetical protein
MAHGVGIRSKISVSFAVTQFISLPVLAGREFKRFHRYGESMLERTNLIDAGGI